MGEIRLACEAGIAEGQVARFNLVGGRKVALVRAGGRWFAFEDRCSHDDGDLAGGRLVGQREIECPRHGGRFDIESGRATRMPAVAPIETYPVEVRNGEIWIKVAEE